MAVLWKEKNVDHTKTGEKVMTAGNLMTQTTMDLNVGVGWAGDQKKIEGFQHNERININVKRSLKT